MKRFPLYVFALVIFMAAAASSASAQATRTWVSGLGDDANPCSRTAPCKTFPGAYSKTATGGEIDVIDPGGFGTISIGHAITIDGGCGIMASILSAGTNGVVINAGPADVITLRCINIQGVSQYGPAPGLNGIIFNSGAALLVDRCVLENFTQIALNFQPTTPGARLQVNNTSVRNAVGGGINVSTNSGSPVFGAIHDSILTASLYGVQAGINGRVGVTRSYANGNTDGFLANGAGAQLSLDSVASTDNQNGAHAKNSGNIHMGTSQVTANTNAGLNADSGGTLTSWGNNRIDGNGPTGAQNGAFNTTIMPY